MMKRMGRRNALLGGASLAVAVLVGGWAFLARQDGIDEELTDKIYADPILPPSGPLRVFHLGQLG